MRPGHCRRMSANSWRHIVPNDPSTRATGMAATDAHAREALQPRATEAIPVFPVQAVRVLRFRRTAVMALSAAAALLFGIGIGVHLHLAQPSAGPVLAAQPTNASVVAPATAGVLDIWSSNRLLAVALESKREAQPQWRWSCTRGPAANRRCAMKRWRWANLDSDRDHRGRLYSQRATNGRRTENG